MRAVFLRLTKPAGLLPLVMLFNLALAVSPAVADTAGIPWRGRPAVSESTDEIMRREAAARAAHVVRQRETEPRLTLPRDKRPNPDSPEVSTWPPNASRSELRLDAQATPYLPQTVAPQFTGAT